MHVLYECGPWLMTYPDLKSILVKQTRREKREGEREKKGKATPQAPAGKRKERVPRQISFQ